MCMIPYLETVCYRTTRWHDTVLQGGMLPYYRAACYRTTRQLLPHYKAACYRTTRQLTELNGLQAPLSLLRSHLNDSVICWLIVLWWQSLDLGPWPGIGS